MEEQISVLTAELQQTRSKSGPSTTSRANLGSASNLPVRETKVTPAKSPETHFVEDNTGAIMFLGKNSDPQVALGCREAASDAMLNDRPPSSIRFSSIIPCDPLSPGRSFAESIYACSRSV
jgi:hypothetical protein